MSRAPRPVQRGWVAGVPGKAILAGEHAAVYGRPALLASLGVGVEVQLSAPSSSPESAEPSLLHLDLLSPSGATQATVRWTDALALAQRAAEAWERSAQEREPFVPLTALLLPTDRARTAAGAELSAATAFAQVALAETWWEWCSRHGVSPWTPAPTLHVRIASRLPLGAGCGSSAAVACAVAMGLDGWLADAKSVQRAELEQVEQLVHVIERRQHGRPSGIDGAIVLRGGVLFAQRSEAHWNLRAVADPARLLAATKVLFTGSRPESTGEVVSAVAALRRGDEHRVDGLFGDIEEAAIAAEAALRTGAGPRFASALSRCHAALDELGVVPPAVRRVIDRLAALGCSAKISGAGSGAGPGAGLLLLYDPDDLARDVIRESRFTELPGTLGGPGAWSKSQEATTGTAAAP